MLAAIWRLSCYLLVLYMECESGGIGRRTRLRIWRGNPWGFESPLSHHYVCSAPSLGEEQLKNPQRFFFFGAAFRRVFVLAAVFFFAAVRAAGLRVLVAAGFRAFVLLAPLVFAAVAFPPVLAFFFGVDLAAVD